MAEFDKVHGLYSIMADPMHGGVMSAWANTISSFQDIQEDTVNVDIFMLIKIMHCLQIFPFLDVVALCDCPSKESICLMLQESNVDTFIGSVSHLVCQTSSCILLLSVCLCGTSASKMSPRENFFLHESVCPCSCPSLTVLLCPLWKRRGTLLCTCWSVCQYVGIP